MWKRDLHHERGTTLIESTSATIRDGIGFTHLVQELTDRGLVLDPRPRPELDRRRLAVDHSLHQLLRTFLTHTKSNRLTGEDLIRLSAQVSESSARTRTFLQVFLPIQAAWEEELSGSGTIDFEDMINQGSRSAALRAVGQSVRTSDDR